MPERIDVAITLQVVCCFVFLEKTAGGGGGGGGGGDENGKPTGEAGMGSSRNGV